jgi:hypothetical protein
MTRNGKIARLPREIRDQLNRRLQNGHPGKQLVAWLNSLPKVRATLRQEFGGRAISEQNLSEWKQVGHGDWLARQEVLAHVRELIADAEELTGAGPGALADHLATVLTARYAEALAGWNGEVTDEFRRKLRSLRGLCQDIMELRRGDHSAARLKIEQERLERDREKTEAEILEHFERWAQNPKVRDLICRGHLAPEKRAWLISKTFGVPPDATANPAGHSNAATNADSEESNPIQPNQTDANKK